MLVEHTGELECTQPGGERVESVMAGAGEGGITIRAALPGGDEGSTHVTSSSSSITALPAGGAAASS